jgi:hypothetical protein
LILGDTQKLQNFELCQQYLKTLVYNKTTQEKHERQISSLGREAGKGDRGSPERTGNITARTYSREEWSKLTKEEREKIKELRKHRKRARRNTPGARGVSVVQHDDSGDDDNSSYDGSCSSADDVDKTGNTSLISRGESSLPSSPPTRRSGRLVQF